MFMRTQDVLDALDGVVTGLTIADLAIHMGRPRYNVASRVSRLVAYGKVERRRLEGYRHKSIYRLMPEAAR